MMARIRVDLPQPDSPTTPRMRPGSKRQRDIVEHVRDALVGADRHLQAAHVEATRAHRDRRMRGSTMSRRPSPSRLKPITVIRMARPGNVAYHQARGR